MFITLLMIYMDVVLLVFMYFMYTCLPVVSCPDKIIHLNLTVGYEGPYNYWFNFKNTTKKLL